MESKIGLYDVTIQKFDKGKASTVLIARRVVGSSQERLLIRAKRDLGVKDTTTVIWKFIKSKLLTDL